MGKIIDLTGRRFERLVVVGDSGERASNGGVIWDCLCDCGNSHKVRAKSLESKEIRSCGCLKSEVAAKMGAQADGKKVQEWANIFDNKEGTKLSILTQKLSKSNTSGIKGVSWNKKSGKWNSNLTLKGERVLNDFFYNKQDAINARKEAEEKYFNPVLEKYGKKH